MWPGQAADGTAMMMTPGGLGATQPLVYCYSPAPPAVATDLPASLTYHQQLLQQQQMLLAAKSLQQQQQQQHQQVYVQTPGLGLQPYRLAGGSAVQLSSLHGSLALTPANLPYLSPADQLYLPSSPAAAAAGVALTSGRKVRHLLLCHSLPTTN